MSQHDRALLIDTGWPDGGGADNTCWSAKHHRGQRDWIDADIQQRATAQRQRTRRDSAGDPRPAGGYSYQTYNFEYIYRVNDPIRLVLFADAGKAYGYQETFDFSQLRYSFGAELRLFLPVFQFPLRFIYAINPAPEDTDEFEGFQFTIGNTF